MIPGFHPPEAEDESERRVISDVQDYGWHVLNILPSEKNPPFSYSVGLYYNYGHPELLVMGLPHKVSHGIINAAGAHIGKGAVYQPGDRADELVEGFQCGFIKMAEEHYREYLGFALWFYKPLRRAFPVLQLTWPDKQGRLPREEGYDESFYSAQKLLDVR